MSNYRSTFHEEQVTCGQCGRPVLVSAMQQHVEFAHVLREEWQARGERTGGRHHRKRQVDTKVPWRARNEFGM